MKAGLIAGICGAAVAISAAAGAAAEDHWSANYQLPGCKAFLATNSSVPFLSQGKCLGLIEGIAFMAVTSDVLDWRCAAIPDEVTGGQLVRVVTSYIEARPARMHEQFETLALEALINAWPCPRIAGK
jgi:hypothetical protein